MGAMKCWVSWSAVDDESLFKFGICTREIVRLSSKAVESLNRLPETEVKRCPLIMRDGCLGINKARLIFESRFSTWHSVAGRNLTKLMPANWKILTAFDANTGALGLWCDIAFYMGRGNLGTEHLKITCPFMTQRAFVLWFLFRNCRGFSWASNWSNPRKYLSQLDTSDVRKLEQVD